MLHGHVVVAATDLNYHSVIFQPYLRVGLASEFADPGGQPEVVGNIRYMYITDDALWTRWYGTTRDIMILAFSQGSTPVD